MLLDGEELGFSKNLIGIFNRHGGLRDTQLAYLNALPSLLAAGKANQWFACNGDGTISVVAPSSREIYAQEKIEPALFYELRIFRTINEDDIILFAPYYKWKETQDRKRQSQNEKRIGLKSVRPSL